MHSFPYFSGPHGPHKYGELYAHVWGCMQPVPCAHAHLSTSAPCRPQYNIAQACGCNQPQAFGHMLRHRFPYFDWACATFPRTTHGSLQPNAGLMHAVECLPLLAPTCLGIYCPFVSNIVQHSSEAHAMHAIANGASTWGIGTAVCMRTGQRHPSVHVQGQRPPSVHVQ